MPRPRERQHDPEPSHSVLDLLLFDTKPEAGSRKHETFEEALARDLHMLLNTRREEKLIPSGFEQCASSLLNFGVPDLTHCGALQVSTEQMRLCRWLEDAIRTFEPRLRNVSVRLVDTGASSPHLRFRLEAHAETVAHRVSFEMGLKRDTGEMSVLPR